MSWPTLPGIQAVELSERDAEETLVTDFGALSLVPIEQDEWAKKLERAGLSSKSERSSARSDSFDRHFAPLLAPFAPPQSEVHRITEEQRQAADTEINRRKNSGEMLRRDIDREIVAVLNSQAANNPGGW